MNVLASKLIVTPLLVGSTSLAGRRWGSALSGWLVALPLTSGPIVLFLAIEHGATMAARAATGAIAGAIAQVAFCVAYAGAARRAGWLPSLTVAALAFAAVGMLLPPMSAVLLFLGLVVATAGALAALPRVRVAPPIRAARYPRWDLPARMAVATGIVLLITALAPRLGARLAGVLATFPVYISVLTTFAHRSSGEEEAVAVLRGLLMGIAGFAGFFLVLAALVERFGILAGFGAATVIAFAIHGLSFFVLRRNAPRATSVEAA